MTCSMEINGITLEYVYRMWGGKVHSEDIEEAFKVQATISRAEGTIYGSKYCKSIWR